MKNYDHPNHRRGSSPPPTQHEQDLSTHGSDLRSVEQDPDDFRISKRRKMTAAESDLSGWPEDDGMWQDCGGEGG